MKYKLIFLFHPLTGCPPPHVDGQGPTSGRYCLMATYDKQQETCFNVGLLKIKYSVYFYAIIITNNINAITGCSGTVTA